MCITDSALGLFMLAMGVVAICAAVQLVVDAMAARARVLPLGPARCDRRAAPPPPRPALRLMVGEPVMVAVDPALRHPRPCGPFAYGADARPRRAR